jgi:hypothetical protein
MNTNRKTGMPVQQAQIVGAGKTDITSIRRLEAPHEGCSHPGCEPGKLARLESSHPGCSHPGCEGGTSTKLES